MKRDLTGRTFGHWTVVSRAPSKRNKCSTKGMWWCRCDCGNPELTAVRTSNLVSGHSRSCLRHRRKSADGFTVEDYPVEYRWAHNARNRCKFRPEQYAGREFRFPSRVAAVRWVVENLGPRPSPKHSIDRINNNGHYEPGNLRWATQKQQCRNMRTTVVKNFEHAEFIRGCFADGWSATQIARSQAINRRTIVGILENKGWLPDEQSLL